MTSRNFKVGPLGVRVVRRYVVWQAYREHGGPLFFLPGLIEALTVKSDKKESDSKRFLRYSNVLSMTFCPRAQVLIMCAATDSSTDKSRVYIAHMSCMNKPVYTYMLFTYVHDTCVYTQIGTYRHRPLPLLGQVKDQTIPNTVKKIKGHEYPKGT